MHTIYMIARFYPWFAISVALIAGQLFFIFKRKQRPIRWAYLSVSAFFWITTVLWIINRGDIRSDQWVRTYFE